MDVDNGASEGSGSGTMDIEQSLLQQFSCLGTTDREELVQQLQKLLGSSLNYSTAAFFLDMNNWNLQAAVCSYLDIESSTKLPSMALVQDPVASESESIEPNVSFQKVWHIFNNGTEQWPVGCYAQCSDGDSLNGGRVTLPALKPFEDTRLSVQMVSPAVPGVYQSKWRLCTEKGAYFGDPMWVIVTVVEEGTMALTQQLSHFTELGASPPTQVTHNPFIPQRSHIEQSQAIMSRFFVVVFACLAIASAKQQKLSVAAPAEQEAQSTGHSGLFALKFEGDYSAHGGKKYSSSAELTSLAHSSAVQANTAVRNQQTAGIQAALGAQSGYARAALEAASGAQVALVAKQVIVQNLERELQEVQHQLEAERSQYQQTIEAAGAAQTAAQQGQTTSAGTLLAAIQQSVQQTEQAAAAANTVAANQRQMVQEARERVGHIHSRLSEALAGLQETQRSAERAAASAQVAQTNAAASAQLVAVNSLSANSQIEEHETEIHH